MTDNSLLSVDYSKIIYNMIEKNNSTPKSIDAYKYAKDFEELSLEVVLFKESLTSDTVIDKDTTQKTRDMGVDAYIVLKINNTYSTYTIEAKLRSGSKLSLNDFATSILYCLVNTSYKHFVVTNVSFSKESVKYIAQLNNKKIKNIELYDGKILRDIINGHIGHFKHYPQELINYILSQKVCKNLDISFQHSNVDISADKISTSLFQKNLIKANDLLDIGTNLFLVSGLDGVGKHTWIEIFCEQERIRNNYSVYRLDLSTVQTPRLIIIELLRFILGIDIEKLFYELSEKEQFLEHVFSEMQTFAGYNSNIATALHFLLSCQNVDTDEYIYLMKILMEHIYHNFLEYGQTIILVENLHLVNEETIKFTIDLIRCMCNKDVIFILNILIPQHPRQLLFIETEQWFGYIRLLEQFRIQDANTGKIELRNMNYEETVEVINAYLNGPVLTPEYYKEFIEYFGTNPSTVFSMLKVIKNKKMYSYTILNSIKETSYTVENYIIELLDYNNSFFKEIFVYICLLDGRIDEIVLSYLNNKYSINSKLLLFKKGILDGDASNISISGSYFTAIQKITNYVEEPIKKSCAAWLLENIHSLNIFRNEVDYFNIRCLYIVNPSQAILQIDESIKNLTANQLYAYTIKLAELRYLYYKKVDQKLLYYKNLVKYIYYITKYYTRMSENAKVLMYEAEFLKKDLSAEYFIDETYIDVNLELALINYYIAKNQYNYQMCEEYIMYILSYENCHRKNDIFALARIYMALIKKEQGLRNQFIIELATALRKYPSNKDVKVSYYANLAAMYKFRNISVSIKLLNLVQQLTYNENLGHGDLWTKIDLLNYWGYCNLLESSQILQVRREVEKQNSLNNLARTFNLEGYFNISNRNILLAKECLEAAIFHCISSGKNKQYFLFGLNLVNVLLVLHENCDAEFYNVYNWFQKNKQQIVERLHNNPYRKTDHMFVALISLVYIIKKRKQDSLISTLEINEIFPEIEEVSCEQLKTIIPSFYINQDVIFILF